MNINEAKNLYVVQLSEDAFYAGLSQMSEVKVGEFPECAFITDDTLYYATEIASNLCGKVYKLDVAGIAVTD